jgi:hypothetical protein
VLDVGLLVGADAALDHARLAEVAESLDCLPGQLPRGRQQGLVVRVDGRQERGDDRRVGAAGALAAKAREQRPQPGVLLGVGPRADGDDADLGGGGVAGDPGGGVDGGVLGGQGPALPVAERHVEVAIVEVGGGEDQLLAGGRGVLSQEREVGTEAQ